MIFSTNSEYRLSAEEVAQRRKQISIFPNQISDGSFTPHSTIVEVTCFHAEEVLKSIANNTLMTVRKDLQVLCHELTHWLDFFGTVWGRHYINDICKGYRAVERNSEDEFPNLVHLFDQDRKILSPAYYRFTKTPVENHGVHRPWTLDFTCGLQIDPMGNVRQDIPIFMAKFGENPSRRTFARQPVSVGALLEVRAIASEIEASLSSIATHPNEDEKKLELHMAKSEFSKMLYDHELIEYNTAAHILSVNAQCTDFVVTSRLASALAYIALNMTSDDFRNLKPPKSFDAFGRRNKFFKKNLDRGYAFVCMVFNGGIFDGNEDEYIDICVRSSNLGSPEDLLQRAVKIIEEPFWISGGNAVAFHFAREAAFGKAIMESISAQPRYTFSFSQTSSELRNILPPFIDAEGAFIEFKKGRLEEYRPDEMHRAAHAMNEYTRNLLIGCRGV